MPQCPAGTREGLSAANGATILDRVLKHPAVQVFDTAPRWQPTGKPRNAHGDSGALNRFEYKQEGGLALFVGVHSQYDLLDIALYFQAIDQAPDGEVADLSTLGRIE